MLCRCAVCKQWVAEISAVPLTCRVIATTAKNYGISVTCNEKWYFCRDCNTPTMASDKRFGDFLQNHYSDKELHSAVDLA